jgi:hypothetical protein
MPLASGVRGAEHTEAGAACIGSKCHLSALCAELRSCAYVYVAQLLPNIKQGLEGRGDPNGSLMDVVSSSVE